MCLWSQYLGRESQRIRRSNLGFGDGLMGKRVCWRGTKTWVQIPATHKKLGVVLSTQGCEGQRQGDHQSLITMSLAQVQTRPCLELIRQKVRRQDAWVPFLVSAVPLHTDVHILSTHNTNKLSKTDGEGQGGRVKEKEEEQLKVNLGYIVSSGSQKQNNKIKIVLTCWVNQTVSSAYH